MLQHSPKAQCMLKFEYTCSFDNWKSTEISIQTGKAIHKERGKPKVLQTHQPAATIYFETGKLGGSSIAVATTGRNNCSLSFAREAYYILA